MCDVVRLGADLGATEPEQQVVSNSAQTMRQKNQHFTTVIENVGQNQDLTAASDDPAYICAQLFQTDGHISSTGCRPVCWEARMALLYRLSL